MTNVSNSDIFADVVGQEKAKNKLNFFLLGHRNTGVVPALIFSAAKGVGKTYLAKEFRKGLLQREGDDAGQRKPLHTIPCTGLGRKGFFDYVIKNRLWEKEVTILLDEAHGMKNDLAESLLTILQPNAENRNEYTYDDFVLEFDMKRITWMFATSEIHKMNKPLLDRFERIDLEDYQTCHLAEIIRRNMKGVQFDDGVLENEVVTVLRGNARSAQKMAGHIKSYLGSLTTFFSEDWANIKKALGILPLGLTPLEVRVLEILKEHKETSLTRIAAVTGMSPEAVRQDIEMSLQRLDLMQITTAGRSLTVKGHDYLENLSTQ
jgi:Holliday junction resolvasome RuvABC ATP-dependent DNA helicase subunit